MITSDHVISSGDKMSNTKPRSIKDKAALNDRMMPYKISQPITLQEADIVIQGKDDKSTQQYNDPHLKIAFQQPI